VFHCELNEYILLLQLNLLTMTLSTSDQYRRRLRLWRRRRLLDISSRAQSSEMLLILYWIRLFRRRRISSPNMSLTDGSSQMKLRNRPLLMLHEFIECTVCSFSDIIIFCCSNNFPNILFRTENNKCEEANYSGHL
jgi:hypothetical protein